jgi:hypothetical protein
MFRDWFREQVGDNTDTQGSHSTSATCTLSPDFLNKQAATLLTKFLGTRAGWSIRQITKRDAVGFRDRLSKERSPSTVNKLKAHLTGAFQSVKEEGILDQNVFF